MQAKTLERESIYPFEERAVSGVEFLELVSEELVSMAFREHERRNGPDSKHPQIFHRANDRYSHVQAAVSRVGRSIHLIQAVAPELISPVQEARAKLFVGLHDWEQERDLKDIGTIREQILRKRGENETKNGEEGRKFMQDVNDRFGRRIFVPGDVEVCRAVLDVTIPTWVNELGTVIQERLSAGSSIEAKLAALTDIGAAGEDPAQFIREGNGEFKEVRTGITKAIVRARRDQDGVPILGTKGQVYVMGEIRTWLPGQIKWAEGRKSRLDEELAHFGDPRVIQVLKQRQYHRFDQSIAWAQSRAYDSGRKSFAELLVLMGYLEPIKRRLVA